MLIFGITTDYAAYPPHVTVTDCVVYLVQVTTTGCAVYLAQMAPAKSLTIVLVIGI